MPKVSAEKAKKIAAATDPFAPLPKGFHRIKLVKVESGKSRKGDQMWTWTFKVPEYPGKEVKYWTLLRLEWSLKEVFEAFQVPFDTDTDDLLGKEIVVEIDQRPSNMAVRKGKPEHYIAGFPSQDTEPRLFEEDEDLATEPAKNEPADEPPPF